jgi:C-terminal processing protease CtpA/Prc
MQAQDSRVAEALTQVKAAEKELEEKYAEVEEFKRRTAAFEDDKQILNINKNFLEHEVQRLREQIEASEKLLANATQESESLMNKLTLADSELARTLQVISEQHDEIQKPTNGTERAIELAKFLRDEVAGSSIANRKSISTASGGTTVGISFNTMSASVIACMEGGPAFNSKQVHTNDVIIAIDGQEVKGPEILGLLIGNDKPGSVVELTLKRKSVGSFYFAFSVL